MILTYIKTTTIFNSYSIAFLFFGAGCYLLRAAPIALWKYIVLLLPLVAFSLFIAVSMLTSINSSPVVGGFAAVLAYKISVFDVSRAIAKVAAP